jgi:hypothetical protein
VQLLFYRREETVQVDVQEAESVGMEGVGHERRILPGGFAFLLCFVMINRGQVVVNCVVNRGA